MIKPNYICPFRYNDEAHNLILCKNLMREGKDYSKDANARVKVMCGNVYYCNKLHRWENTKWAENCPFKNK